MLEKDTGEKTKDGKPVMELESERGYVKRALNLTPSVTFDQVQALITKRARGYTTRTKKGEQISIPALALDIKSKPRVGRARKLAEKYKNVALEFLLVRRAWRSLTKCYHKLDWARSQCRRQTSG